MAVYDIRAGRAQELDLSWDRRKLRALYRGDRNVSIGAFKGRFMGFAGSSGNYSGYDESDRNILVENELKPLIDQRIEAVPETFELACDDEAALASAQEWALGPVTPDGMDLYALFEQAKRAQEMDGAAVLRLGRAEDGTVWVEARDAVRLERRLDDPANPAKVTGWLIGWTRTEDGREVEYQETITETEEVLTAGGHELRRIAHGLGFIPVVVIPRTMELGGELSMPGPGELVEAYLNFLWATYARNIANKYAAFRVWCPADELTLQAILGDGSGNGLTSHSIYPGAILKGNFEPRGGDQDLSSLENQRAESLRTLRELGRGESDPQDRTDMRSGKASVIQSRGLLRYAAMKGLLLRIGLGKLLELRQRLAEPGTATPPRITVMLHNQDEADPETAIRTAEMLIKAFVAGLLMVVHVLREFQRIGILDEDADIEQMAADIEEKGAAEQAEAMERMAAQLKARPGAGNPGDEAGNDEDDEVVSDGDAE